MATLAAIKSIGEVATGIKSSAQFVLKLINESEKLVYNMSRGLETINWSVQCADYLASRSTDQNNAKDKLFYTAVTSLHDSIVRLQLLLEKWNVKDKTLLNKAVLFFTAKDKNENLDRHFSDIDNCLLRLKYQHQIVCV